MDRNRSNPEAWGALHDEYEILGELGRGGTAVVYLARDRELGREVAIKVVRTRFVDDDEALARFAREARTVAQLQHPNIVTVHAVRRLADGSLALVMQYVPGRTLKQVVLQEAPLPFDRIEAILRDVAAALDYAHRHEIVHRDVKPENIFLDDRTGQALLSDFGTARSLQADTRLTLEGAAIGTPAYMAPEQIDGTGTDERSDLFSLALVGWEMVTGEAPWEGESLYSIIYKQKHEQLPPLRRMRPDTPPHLWYALERALRKDPDARPASAQEFVAELGDRSAAARWRRLRATLLGRSAPRRARGSTRATPPPEASETIRYLRPADAVPATTPAPVLPAGTRWAAQRRAAAAALVLLAGSAAVVSALSFRPSSPQPEPPAAPRIVERERTADPPAPVVALAQSAAAPADTAASLADSAVLDTAPALAAPASTPPAPPPLAPAPARVARAEPIPPPRTESTPRPAARETASAPAPRAASATAWEFAAGGTHTCALARGGQAFCWGGNGEGQLGSGSTSRGGVPVPIGGRLRFASLTAGVGHTCGIARGGDAYCWGDNGGGQLGTGGSGARSTPARVAGEGSFTRLAAGMSHTCGVTRGDDVLCWGDNAHGQLGDGKTEGRSVPAPVAGGGYRAIAVGWNHSCALDRQGDIRCWGEGRYGQLGDGSSVDRRVPTSVAGDPWFVSVTAGSAHTCAVTGEGDAFCWGRNSYGQLGDGGTSNRDRPRRVEGGRSWGSLTAGSVHTCGLAASGGAFCWGRNSYGQLGDGSTSNRSAPVRVEGGHKFASIRASGAHTCGTTTAGENLCWGYNVEGQLGDGTRTNRTTPVRVRAPRG